MAPSRGWLAVLLVACGAFAPAGAAEPVPGLTAELHVSYPERREGVTVVRLELALPATTAPAALDVEGEIFRQGERFETFRYRFAPPRGAGPDETLRLPMDRLLMPGPYEMTFEGRDPETGATFRVRRELEVPLLPTAEGGSSARVLIEPPPEEMVTGPLRVRASVRGREVARVRFELDGESVLTKRDPPYDVSLDLGARPRPHRLRVVALDEADRELASDEIRLNVGPHRFAIRLLEAAPAGPGRLRAAAAVDVPREETVERVDWFLDETRIATQFQAPLTIELPFDTARPPSTVRAEARLTSGATADDLAFLGGPAPTDVMEVDVVELFVTVVDRRGRPIADLGPEAFRVFEDDRPQRILRFARIEQVPVHAGILLDTSTSMAESIDEAEAAALGFFQETLTPRDRAAVITFDDEPRLRVPFTNRIEVLAGGLADLEVQGETALYDSLVHALHYFSGLRGKLALILLSDGADVTSRFGFDDVLELARRTGVAIYPIGLGLPGNAQRERTGLLRLASETGGRAFFVQRAGELRRIHETIEEELRGQYLVVYQSDAAGEKDRYRSVRVEVAGEGREARTREGYYP